LQLLQRHLTTHLQQFQAACAPHLQTLQQDLASLKIPAKKLAGLQSSIQACQSAIDGLTIAPSTAQSLNICQEEVRRLDEIIQHFLKAVRPQPLHLKRDNPITTLKAVLSVLQPQLDNSNITIEWSIATPLTTIFIDAARLHQVFFNVLKNAIEAIGANGRIRISCYQTERDWVVAFADSGCGISTQQAMRMLSNQNSSQKPSGHGIGMLIIRRIMQEHNGCIEIESKANLGSIVYLKFPLPEPALRQLGSGCNPASFPPSHQRK
jgi:signal transduction histidine kinase